MNPKRHTGIKVALGTALAAVLCLLVVWCVFLVRDKLLSNADRMGTSLATTYAAEEENRFSVYRYFLRLGSSYLDDLLNDGATEEELSAWLNEFADNMTEALGENIIDPYVVINGTIIAANPWEGDDSYDYATTQWYQNAVSNPGRTTYTDAYTDAITGGQIVTLATAIGSTENVAAFDIRLENLNASRNTNVVPGGGSYYLFDRNGNLLYTTSALDTGTEEVQAYLQHLLEVIEADTDETDSTNIAGTDGMNRNVYYSQMDNGWLSVITIPTHVILQDGWDFTLLAIAVVFAAIVLVAASFMVYSRVQERKARHTADTLKLLGDTFYAIYRVNYVKGTYEAIKSSPDVKDELGEYGQRGNYQHLIDVVKKYVDEHTYAEFEKSFSLDNIRSLVKEGVTEFGGDFRRKFPSGVRWVSIRIVHNGDLGLNEVIMCFRDIEREKQRDLARKELLENALDSARRTVEKKSVYFRGASHDMRTPLNAIIGLTELAQRDVTNQEKTLDYLGKIESAGQQLLELVNDVLDVSRLEHGESGMVNYAPMSLRECVEKTIALFQDQVQREGKHLDTHFDVMDDKVYGDAKRMSQILNNLVSNALKYSFEGARVHISLRETARNGKTAKYQLDVSDTGVGMSEEFLSEVFEPFARETMFAPTGVTGTGLGMPIVKSLVQQMSGEISVRSKLGEGSTFSIVLPLIVVEDGEEGASGAADGAAATGAAKAAGVADAAGVGGAAGAGSASTANNTEAKANTTAAAHSAQDAASAASSAPGSPALSAPEPSAPSVSEVSTADGSTPAPGDDKNDEAGNSPAFTLEGKTVLIAEDNEINMLIATEFLHALGAQTIEASNGEEALRAFAESQLGVIDAILMDMQMPVMDGCDAARAIRALEREDAAKVPIIAVTANAFSEDIAKTSEAGMDDHLPKPFSVEELITVLQKHLAN